MIRRVLPFAALLAWCGALVALRLERSNSASYAFLIWNLFLAAIPFGAALVVDALDRLRRFIALQWFGLIVWLLFLPNAPYIVTDFIHLRQRPHIPLWYDVLLLISSAGTGLLLGYGSVMIVQRITARRYGRKTGWFVAIVSLLLSAFGIYLGRFLRWNSWEVLSDPRPLFVDIAERLMNPLDHPTTLAVTGLFGVALTLGYVALHALSETARDDAGDVQ
ncbi:MAG TPA: DUF1361 domain-containing protein [Thermoanaerobaculia bacterium]|nr:DUF1361 domain-containing protein [Thermoanaerobaculia bacterium]